MNSFWKHLGAMAQILRNNSDGIPMIEQLRAELIEVSHQDPERIADDRNDVSTAHSNLATIDTVEPERGPAQAIALACSAVAYASR